jgi:hypothetical protein
MNARNKEPAAPAETSQDLADRHDLRIHRAKQRCQQVGYQGLNHFVAGFCHHDGDREMTVYSRVAPSRCALPN